MNTKEIIKSQYRASLAMLEEAITKCPDEMWDDPDAKQRFWHICFHTLFFTHLYLQVDEQTFVPWEKHRDEYQFFESLPWPPHRAPKIGDPYTKAEIFQYLVLCQNEVDEKVDTLDLHTESGFNWFSFSKLELQFLNIRHIQHHTGQLDDRLRINADIGIRWTGPLSKDRE